MLLKNNILRVKSQSMTLFPIFDTHLGEAACDLKFIKRYIQRFKDTENAYGFLGGDILDTTIYGGKGNVHEQKCFMNDQKDLAIELFKPIKHRLIGALEGNHESRLIRSTTFSIIQDICRELDIEYWGEEKNFAIQLNKGGFIRVFAHHGISSGATEGGSVNGMCKLHWQSPMCDLVLSGHVHRLINFSKTIRYLSSTGAEMEKNQLFVSCGTALGRAKYAKTKAYAPAPIGQQIIFIKRSCHNKSSTYNEIKVETFM